MSNMFHLAILAGNLDKTINFYTEILGCKTTNGEEGKWIDIDFWGNELTLHSSETTTLNERHHVAMGNVAVPHFGVHLDREVFDDIKERLAEHNIEFLDSPYIRFPGTEYEQETFFIEDPNGNILELKTLQKDKNNG